jgi:Methane oxygenase PmoA
VRVLPVVLLSLAVSFLSTPAGQRLRAADKDVSLTLKADTLEVAVGGEPFTTYHFGKDQKKPYFWPIRDAQGQIITRNLVQPTDRPRPDHPHHRGLWFSVDEVNGIKFWAEGGRIINVSVDPLVPKGNPARFKVVNHWLDRQRQPLLIETTTISVYDNRLIAYDATLAAAKDPVTFGDTKEGLFGFRMVNSMRGSAGKIVSADGHHGESECWGKPFEWIDYDGPVNGKLEGIAIFDNPHNFRPSRYHVRNYGLFSISPFGEGAYTNGKNPAKPVHLAPGANLRLRYAIYVHDGDTKAADVAGVYHKYVAESGG